MTEKYASIARMKSLMKEKNLTSVFLENVIYTTWPGENKPYSIRRVEYEPKDDRIVIWQHWDQSNTGHYIEDFEDEKVFRNEKELRSSIEALKKYRVFVTAWVDVMATNPNNAKKTISLCPSDEYRDKVTCIVPTGEIKEL